jgi:hypothetical protein
MCGAAINAGRAAGRFGQRVSRAIELLLRATGGERLDLGRRVILADLGFEACLEIEYLEDADECGSVDKYRG